MRLETHHHRWIVCCGGNFHANGNNTEAYTAIIFFKNICIFPQTILDCVISLDQLESVYSSMHFNNSVGTYQEPSKNFKICRVLSHVHRNFQSLYLPWQTISVGEFNVNVQLSQPHLLRERKQLNDTSKCLGAYSLLPF